MKHKISGVTMWRSILVAILIICFFVSIIFLYYRMLYRETRENIIKSGEINAIQSAERVDDYLSAGAELIQLTGYTMDNMIREKQSNEKVLEYLVNQSKVACKIMPGCTIGLYAYVNDEYLDGVGWEPDEDYVPTKRPWYVQATANNGKVVAVDPYLDSLSGTYMISLAKTLCDGKSVVAMDLSMDRLQKIAEDISKKESSDIEVILDHTHHVIAHTNKEEVGKDYLNNTETLGNIVVRGMDSSDGSCFFVEYQDTEYIVYALPVKNDWTCVSVINATIAFDSLRKPLVITIVSTVLAVVVLLLILINMNRKSVLAKKMSLQSEKALAASSAKSAFLSNMSHEIRTPINAILGMNEMILRESRDSEVLDYAQNIRTAGRTLLGLVNGILDFSKIEAGKMEIFPAEYSLASVLGDLVNMVQIKAEAKGLQFVAEFNPELPSVLYGDEIRMKQIIVNILTNAVKYTETGRVKFSVDFDKNEDEKEAIWLKVSVRDTGIGIRPEDMERLSLEFDRIEEERNRSIEGTGLGLSITKRLLNMMESDLEVESVYGKGSNFSFVLRQKVINWEPIGDYKLSYHTAGNSTEIVREKFTAPSAAVLAVDDNPMNLLVLENLLKGTRIRIDKAGGGDEGLIMAGKKKYDVIFLDHMMPVKNGIETLHELRDQAGPNSDTPVICLTANAISGAKEQYIKEGFDGYLSKPIHFFKLEDMLLEFLPKEKVAFIDRGQSQKNEQEGVYDATAEQQLKILRSHTQIDVDGGLKNNGTVSAYISVLNVFYETIESIAAGIEEYYQNQDIENYTIKIHALKSSARIVGAVALGEEAQRLEDAGKRGDIDTIRRCHDDFMEHYREFSDILRQIFEEDTRNSGKKPADDAMMKAAYRRIYEAADEMDFDKIEEVLDELKQYVIPDHETERFALVKAKAYEFDYSGIRSALDNVMGKKM